MIPCRAIPWATASLLTLASISGCGGAIAERATSSRASTRVGERELVVVERALDGHVALSLFIDAGTLDGGATALVAAELVSMRDPSIEALVTPDGTRFHTLCRADEPERCVERLGSALATRSPSEEAVSRARERVESARQRGLASARREAEVLAVSAALGLELSPLGDPTTEVGSDTVGAFLEDHFGDERSLWIAIGDAREADVVDALARLPRVPARRARGERQVRDDAPRVSAAERPGEGTWAVARRTSSEASAVAIAEAWRRRPWREGARAYAFPTRAGWIALSSFTEPEPLEDEALVRWAYAHPWPSAANEADDDAWGHADRIGARWVAGEPQAREDRVGIALVGAEAEERVARLTLMEPPPPWQRAPRLEAPEGSPPLLLWALEGPAWDGVSALGASTIAARLLEEGCASGLDVQLTADAILVFARGGAAADIAARADALFDCVSTTRPSTADIEAARVALLARLGPDDERRAVAATALLDAAPGLVIPSAGRRALADVSAEDILDRWASWPRTGRWAIVADADALAAFGEPPRERSADLPAQPPLITSEAEPPPSAEVPRARADVEHEELLVALALPACGDESLASAWHAELRRSARALGVEVTWSAMGASRAFAWAALTARGEPSSLDALLAEPPPPPDLPRSDAQRVVRLARADRLAARAALGAPLERCAEPPTRRVRWIDPFPRQPPPRQRVADIP